ncbi:hypothetical protein DNC80_15880, partial [Flavobacterium sp. SOK18b]|uniref:hypothetical protein n=1 Tax=Flavobacterium sp. SOK18b TaxID=797900 RepID=UPI0015F9AED1
MKNEYKKYIDNFFSTLLEYKHTTSRVNKILILDYQKYTEIGSTYSANSTLFLSDWTGETDNGWALPFHSGIFKETLKENYKNEILNILSREFCLIYSQCYEALEKYFKDCVLYKSENNIEFEEYIKRKFKIQESIKREDLKGGERLFRLIKKMGNKSLQDFSKSNNANIKFGELINILSEARHCIVHSKCIIHKNKISKTDYHFEIFKYLFNYCE